MAKWAQAGSFGGSRQAILQGLNQENLLRQQAETAGAGYEKAYTNAAAQFNADQNRKMDAVRLNIQQAQKAADLGMSDAQLMAQYGMDAQKANELSKQFGATYRQTGLSNAANTEQARAAAGAQEAQYGLQNLSALSAAGAQQHDIEQAALDAQYKDWLRQTDYPGKQLEQMKGITTAMAGVLPKSEVAYGQKQSALQTAAGGVAGLTKLANDLGIPLDTLKSVFGITGLQSAANEANKTASDSSYGYIGNTPGARAGTDTPEGTHRDENNNLVDDSTGEILSAQGGLIDILHKMRGQK
jgi:hypothetical protein